MEFQNLLILMVVIWIAGKFFRSLGWPVIFGELLAGILVGPLILGLVNENNTIKILAELGIFFLMLHSGLETDPEELFKASKKAIIIAIGGVVLPFIGGYAVSRAFDFSVGESLFIGMGLSVTAIAVSARLFKDFKIEKTHTAHIAMGAAVVDDILALILFSVILDYVTTGTINIFSLAVLIAKVLAFFGVILWIGKKFIKQLGQLIYHGNKGFTMTLIIALLFGMIAEAMGLHIIIGAFMAGVFVKEEAIEQKVFNKIEDRVYGLSYGFLGPIFFVSLGFHIDLSALLTNPWFVFAIVMVAIFGKVIGAGGIAYFMDWHSANCAGAKSEWNSANRRESLGNAAVVGMAMNSRGAVELIIASIGLSAGIINAELFSVLVIMAFATTIVSIIGMKPLVAWRKPS